MNVLVACEFSGRVRDAFLKRGHNTISCDLLPTEKPGPHFQGDIFELLRAQEIIKNHVVENPCVKLTTIAVIINKDKFWIGDNSCDLPQKECPRGSLPTGVGYELCKTICKQPHHAEVSACLKAGVEAEGGNLFLSGHYYCCDPCLDTMKKHEIKNSCLIPEKGWDMMIAHDPCTYQCNSGVRWLHTEEGRWKLLDESCEFTKKLLNADIEKIVRENPIPHKYAIERIGRKYDQIIHPWQHGHPESKATCLWLQNLEPLEPTNIVSGREQRIWKLSPSKDRSKLRSETFPGIAEAFAQQWG